MSELVSSLTADISSVFSGIAGWFSRYLIGLQLAGFLIIVGALALIFYLLLAGEIFPIIADFFRDKLVRKNLVMVRTRRAWKKILKFAGSRQPKKWREAALEAETLLKDWLTMKELTDEVGGLAEARALARSLRADPKLEITQEQTVRSLRAYKGALREIGV